MRGDGCEGGGRTDSCCDFCFVILSLTMHPFRDGSTFPAPNRYPLCTITRRSGRVRYDRGITFRLKHYGF